MNKVVSAIHKNPAFFLGFICVLMPATLFLLIDGNSASFLLLNTYHPSLLNNFFIAYTFVGNGLFAICLIAIYFFAIKKKQEALILLYAFLSSGIIVQIVKNLFNSPRPKLFFGNHYPSFFINGIQFCYNNSFPSGHTATAFAIATTVVLLSKNKKIQVPVLLLAILVAYSRIYLGQHFLLDVLVGSSIGIICGVCCVCFASHFRNTRRFYRQLFPLKPQSAVTSPGTI
jgi:membrane-associated phospholipid phosphatase